jgi:hypothetical protein
LKITNPEEMSDEIWANKITTLTVIRKAESEKSEI